MWVYVICDPDPTALTTPTLRSYTQDPTTIHHTQDPEIRQILFFAINKGFSEKSNDYTGWMMSSFLSKIFQGFMTELVSLIGSFLYPFCEDWKFGKFNTLYTDLNF